MHVPTHILSGWLVANVFPFTARERLLCMIAAAAPDVDGIGFFFGEATYHRFHHIVAHNVFFGIALSVGLAAMSRRKVLAAVAYLVCFHLHLLMDYFGSGVGWKIHYLWPVEQRGFKTDAAWPLTSWQNYAAFAALAAASVVIGFRKRRSPLELLLPRFEARLFPEERAIRST